MGVLSMKWVGKRMEKDEEMKKEEIMGDGS